VRALRVGEAADPDDVPLVGHDGAAQRGVVKIRR
jgi:hypothetical protein